MGPVYRYRARLDRVIDGDTFVAVIDLGFRVSVAIKVRIRGVDTPERGEDGWADARDFLWQALARDLIIESYKDRMTFERWVCDVWTIHDEGVAVPVAQQIIDAGHGTPA